MSIRSACTCIQYIIIIQEIFPGKYHPSVSHKFISLLEKKGKLLRNYTQNIDTLEEAAGISKIVYCHGMHLILKTVLLKKSYVVCYLFVLPW